MQESLNKLAAGLDRVAGASRGLAGWRRALAAFAAGVAGALAMAPVYALPLLVISFTGFVLLLDGAAEATRPRRAAFAVGWIFGFGYFLAGVYWMAFAFFVQAEQFAWMAPFAVLIMPAGLALFTGAASALAISFWRPGWSRIFVFATAFVFFEYLRGHILSGLPWNLAGQALAGMAISAQTAAWWGAYGLSLVAVFLAAAPAAGLGGDAKRALSGFIAMFAGAAVLFAIGAVRLSAVDSSPSPDAPDAYVRIVQPNIPQREKINPDKWGDNFYRNLNLSTAPRPSADAPFFIIWPENAVPLIDEAEGALSILSRDLPAGAVLITGAVRRSSDADGAFAYYNSIAIIPDAPTGRRPTAFYDKHHLVPFGEYLPFYDLLNRIGLAQLAPYGDGGFTAGAEPSTIELNGLSFAPLVCYEAIFPGAVYPDGQRPRWIVTVTNDAWFGDTSGPRQHLDQARLRSIETGLPMARAANTGVSALIDAKGRMLARQKLYTDGVIDAALPPAIAAPLYARIGDWLFFAMLGLCAIAGYAAARGRGLLPRASPS